MLDNETKRRIDTARNILVGKVPDPKSQVEQITIALIYKFMNDMDAVAEELGGIRTFFSEEFERYSWNNLMAPGMGGYDVLNLYAEAIQKMDFNPNIPSLFRDIFKNAFLPYRDPQTLKMFLKVINDFSYDHSEKLGDAFEYMLSVLGSQGDAGQFRTPRHIIDFIVEVVNPQKNDTILDPACGTAGFLISAYKHIIKTNTKKEQNENALTPDERTTLAENIRGYDISPDMVRLSLVNLYLHGFQTPNIFEYDTLTSQDRWNEYFDVILANPPFMSPKGGIRPHKRFSVQSKRSEVLFVDYMCEHLTPNGQAGIIVPEGIIFQSSNAYKQLREMLIKNYLYAVVSLPAGVFQPYAGVKTSILLIDKKLAKRTAKILFVKIENDGFDLGAQRRPIEKNDLPKAIKLITNYKLRITTGENPDIEKFENALLVDKDKIAESGDWNLSAERYKINENVRNSKFEMVMLKEVVNTIKDGDWIESKDQSKKGIRLIQTGNIGIAEYLDKINKAKYINEETFKKLNCTEIISGDIILSRLPDPVGRACFVPNISEKMITAVDCSIIRFNKDKIFPELFIYYTKSEKYYEQLHPYLTGASRKRISRKNLEKIKIPLPPLEIQKEIVAKIEGFQKIIDGAKAVVENYKPQIQIDPEWEMMELGEVCEIKSGGTPSRKVDEYWNGKIPWIGSTVCKDKKVSEAREFITELGLNKSAAKLFKINTTLIALVGATIGKTGLLKIKSTTNQNIAGLFPIDEKLLHPIFLFYSTQTLNSEFMRLGSGKFRMANLSFIRQLQISLPPIEIQKEIVARIEKEQELVNANKELIKIFEQKIRDRIARVWGE